MVVTMTFFMNRSLEFVGPHEPICIHGSQGFVESVALPPAQCPQAGIVAQQERFVRGAEEGRIGLHADFQTCWQR